MLKKFYITCAVFAVFIYISYQFVIGGKCEDFLLSHADSAWAPASMYHLGNLFNTFQDTERAEYIYEVIIDSFTDTGYYEKASYRYFYIAATEKRRKTALIRGIDFLEEFPDSDKAEIVRKRVDILKKV
ncbi:MAG: hypothetical protein ABIH89_03355 [Elusimicrobiota bacterium]